MRADTNVDTESAELPRRCTRLDLRDGSRGDLSPSFLSSILVNSMLAPASGTRFCVPWLENETSNESRLATVATFWAACSHIILPSDSVYVLLSRSDGAHLDFSVKNVDSPFMTFQKQIFFSSYKGLRLAYCF